jgi:hypothetical protein
MPVVANNNNNNGTNLPLQWSIFVVDFTTLTHYEACPPIEEAVGKEKGHVFETIHHCREALEQDDEVGRIGRTNANGYPRMTILSTYSIGGSHRYHSKHSNAFEKQQQLVLGGSRPVDLSHFWASSTTGAQQQHINPVASHLRDHINTLIWQLFLNNNTNTNTNNTDTTKKTKKKFTYFVGLVGTAGNVGRRVALRGIDRSKTPWVIVELHRPMYEVKGVNHQVQGNTRVAEAMRAELEELLRDCKVEIVLAGHYHEYFTTCDGVYKGECVAGGPIHITVGSAGAALDRDIELGTPWSLRNIRGEYGYGRITVPNATDLHFEFVLHGTPDDPSGGQIRDNLWIHRNR